MRCQVDVHTDAQARQDRLEEDVRRGLTARRKSLPPKYFYDPAGSALFERITDLPEYYLTRTENALLEEIAPRLIGNFLPDDIVEIGSGSSEKTRRILDVLDAQGATGALRAVRRRSRHPRVDGGGADAGVSGPERARRGRRLRARPRVRATVSGPAPRPVPRQHSRQPGPGGAAGAARRRAPAARRARRPPAAGCRSREGRQGARGGVRRRRRRHRAVQPQHPARGEPRHRRRLRPGRLSPPRLLQHRRRADRDAPRGGVAAEGPPHAPRHRARAPRRRQHLDGELVQVHTPRRRDDALRDQVLARRVVDGSGALLRADPRRGA